MSPSKICVVGEDKSGPCPGDSGSPLVVYEDAGPSLVGLVSNGAMKCTKGLPGIFTRVRQGHTLSSIYKKKITVHTFLNY